MRIIWSPHKASMRRQTMGMDLFFFPGIRSLRNTVGETAVVQVPEATIIKVAMYINIKRRDSIK